MQPNISTNLDNIKLRLALAVMDSTATKPTTISYITTAPLSGPSENALSRLQTERAVANLLSLSPFGNLLVKEPNALSLMERSLAMSPDKFSCTGLYSDRSCMTSPLDISLAESTYLK
jgi:hypothetical protein